MNIKILDIHDMDDFRKIRLEALRNAPKMFGSRYAIEEKKSLDFFQNCVLNATVFGVYEDNEIIGLATLTQETVAKIAHKTYLSSVYVRPEFRGQGIGAKLLSSVIEYCKASFEQILLSVAADNKSAIRLYEKVGFHAYGLEPKALKDNDEYTDELLMKLFLI